MPVMGDAYGEDEEYQGDASYVSCHAATSDDDNHYMGRVSLTILTATCGVVKAL